MRRFTSSEARWVRSSLRFCSVCKAARSVASSSAFLSTSACVAACLDRSCVNACCVCSELRHLSLRLLQITFDLRYFRRHSSRLRISQIGLSRKQIGAGRSELRLRIARHRASEFAALCGSAALRWPRRSIQTTAICARTTKGFTGSTFPLLTIAAFKVSATTFTTCTSGVPPRPASPINSTTANTSAPPPQTQPRPLPGSELPFRLFIAGCFSRCHRIVAEPLAGCLRASPNAALTSLYKPIQRRCPLYDGRCHLFLRVARERMACLRTRLHSTALSLLLRAKISS